MASEQTAKAIKRHNDAPAPAYGAGIRNSDVTSELLDASTTSLPTGLGAADAEWLDHKATACRTYAAEALDPLHCAERLAEATAYEALAARLRHPGARGLTAPPLVRNGERTLPDNGDIPMTGAEREAAYVVRHPPLMVQAEAGLQRLALARDAGVLPLAVELGADAATPTERTLLHQLAAGHRLAMRLLASADDDLTRHNKGRAMNLNPNAQTEAARSAAAAARLMDACTRVALALDRLRNGNRQVVTVQHVTVTEGGQAVVAGTMTTAKRQAGTGA